MVKVVSETKCSFLFTGQSTMYKNSSICFWPGQSKCNLYVAGTSLGKCIYVPTGGTCCLVEVSTETQLHVNVYKNIIFTGH